MIHGYRIVKGESGRRWAVSLKDPTGATIYVEDPDPKFQNGLGGCPVKFLMADGTIEILNGPWCSNHVSLYDDTGITGPSEVACRDDS